MTLNDLFDTMWRITRVEVTCRNNGTFLHSFRFEPDEPGGNGLRIRIASEEVTYIVGPVNVHGSKTRYGAETAWGYLDGSIPKELMEAKVDILTVGSGQGGYQVYIDTEEVPEMMVEVLKKNLEDKKWRASDETGLYDR